MPDSDFIHLQSYLLAFCSDTEDFLPQAKFLLLLISKTPLERISIIQIYGLRISLAVSKATGH
jgi:hypothetical protein